MAVALDIAVVALGVSEGCDVGVVGECPLGGFGKSEFGGLGLVIVVDGAGPCGLVAEVDVQLRYVVGFDIACELLLLRVQGEVATVFTALAPVGARDVYERITALRELGSGQVGRGGGVRDKEHGAVGGVVQRDVGSGEGGVTDTGVTGEALIEHHAVLLVASQIHFIEGDGVFAFDDGDFTACGFAIGVAELDVACGVDAGTAIAAGFERGAVYGDVAFTAVGGESSAVLALGGDVYIIGGDVTAVGSIETAGGVILRMDFEVAGGDFALLSRGKDGIGTVGVGGQRHVVERGFAVGGEENSILAAEIAGVSAGAVAGFREGAVRQGEFGIVAGEHDVFVGLVVGQLLFVQGSGLVIHNLGGFELAGRLSLLLWAAGLTVGRHLAIWRRAWGQLTIGGRRWLSVLAEGWRRRRRSVRERRRVSIGEASVEQDRHGHGHGRICFLVGHNVSLLYCVTRLILELST